MDWDAVQSDWERYKQDAQTTWKRLDPAELEVVAGNRHKLVDKVRDRYALSHEEAEAQVDSWFRAVVAS